jgi:hypothetical protein
MIMKFLTTLAEQTDRTITIVMDRLSEVVPNNIEYMTPLQYIASKYPELTLPDNINSFSEVEIGVVFMLELMEEYAQYKLNDR